ncbi:AraC family transcriptional regulator [Neobacillus cucumis]|uniref:AraC family transcriptional regulator n=1 Tax=Neobacillus cucumis TaxID=1740721 RepID=UPI00203F622C|nr:AraC family transcriptional regulator [Neobacillus cucumis]MCM3729913.1 AraC family transcriptional regulator [Neobacillus cucumis]
MTQNKTLHILNGQAMFNYYEETHFLEQECMVPFNEAMCFGGTSDDLFSPEFIDIRANVHHVTPEQYTEHTLKPLQPFFDKEFSHIELWFDADMFCQINLITILAWLDQADYKDAVDIHIVGEKFKPVSDFTERAGGYYSIYKQVLIDKTMPVNILPAPIKKGIELYLSYLSKDSDLVLYIQEHKDVPERELVLALINKFTDYGLGDTQYLEIIRNQRKTV